MLSLFAGIYAPKIRPAKAGLLNVRRNLPRYQNRYVLMVSAQSRGKAFGARTQIFDIHGPGSVSVAKRYPNHSYLVIR
jgi:hypothetical protein